MIFVSVGLFVGIAFEGLPLLFVISFQMFLRLVYLDHVDLREELHGGNEVSSDEPLREE